MIGLIIFGFILVCAFYAWFPGATALIVPVFVISVIIGVVLKRLFHSSQNKHIKKDDVPHTEYDEFDWWQDNQGL